MKSACDKIVLFVLLLSFCKSGDVRAFPELIKDGYGSCKACHYDSAGGGPINPYGRSVAEEKLATWSRAKEGEAFYGIVGTAPFGIAGDFRYLVHHYEDAQVKIDQRFPMQKEVSLILDPSEHVAFVMSGGYYGFEPQDVEYRRYYGKLSFSGLGLRAGRFLPAFGINIPDHTKAIKKDLFGQGKESLNAEISYTHRYFEFFATRILGGNSGLYLGTNPTVLQRDNRDGMAFKGSVFFAKGIQIGGSFAQFDEADGQVSQYSSAHAFFGLPKAWMLIEVQEYSDRLMRGYFELGLEPLHGLWLKTELDSSGQPGENPELFGTMQFFPRPHFEFSGSVSRKQVILISHWYI